MSVTPFCNTFLHDPKEKSTNFTENTWKVLYSVGLCAASLFAGMLSLRYDDSLGCVINGGVKINMGGGGERRGSEIFVKFNFKCLI